MGQIIGKMGVGEVGVGEMGVIRHINPLPMFVPNFLPSLMTEVFT